MRRIRPEQLAELRYELRDGGDADAERKSAPGVSDKYLHFYLFYAYRNMLRHVNLPPAIKEYRHI